MGFVSSLSQTRFKRKINERGVVDSNSVLFHFLLPSLFAAIFSAILQGVGQSAAATTLTSTGTPATTAVTYSGLVGADRSPEQQGGMQMAGWAISIGFGAITGLILGGIYKLLNDSFQEPVHFFNDLTLFEYPKVGADPEQPPEQQQPPDLPESRKAL